MKDDLTADPTDKNDDGNHGRTWTPFKKFPDPPRIRGMVPNVVMAGLVRVLGSDKVNWFMQEELIKKTGDGWHAVRRHKGYEGFEVEFVILMAPCLENKILAMCDQKGIPVSTLVRHVAIDMLRRLNRSVRDPSKQVIVSNCYVHGR